MPLGRVLVVDDEPEVVSMLEEALGGLGYETAGAFDGATALRLVPIYQSDVVLLDLAMPGMSGAEVLAQLRRVDPDLPIIVVSANEDADLGRGTLADGAFDYVRKPFDLEVLAPILSAALVYRGR